MSQYNAFLKFDSIAGESVVPGHLDWIEVLSWSWGASQPSARMAIGTGAGTAGKASIQALTIGKRFDKSSPQLLLRCLNGKVLNSAVLEITHEMGSGKLENVPIMDLKLTSVLVSSIRPSELLVASDLTPGQTPDGFPVEYLTLNFSKFHIDYRPFDVTGKPLATVSTGWDLKSNKLS